MMQPPTEHIRTMLPPAVLVGMVIVIGLYDPTFFSLSNFETVISDTMSLFLMATGLTLVIMMGGIDLSVQAVASMASCILAAYLPELGFLAIPLAVLGGSIAGFGSGFVSIALRIPSFIATLAVSGLVTSAAYWFSVARSVDIAESLTGHYLNWAVGTTAGISNDIWVGAVFLIILGVLLGATPFGRYVRAIGAQERAVIASGINVNRVKIATFMLY